MNKAFAELKRRLGEINDLHGAVALLAWDQATYMPPGGAATRGRQMAALTRRAHDSFVDPAVGSLLDRLEHTLDSLDPDSDEACLIRVTRLDYERATRVPSDYLAELELHGSRGYTLWTEARPENDFEMVADHLERTVDLSRRYASFFPGYDHPADPLIEESDRGMTVARLRPLFAELRRRLIPLLESALAEQDDGHSPLHGCFPESEQVAFGEEVIRAFGFDFRCGRQDRSHHPFATSLGRGDVRITTRVKVDDLSEALFSTLHEAGHAMYEQGFAAALQGTPLAAGASSGVHESQSRLWENVVGRSLEFWRHYYRLLQERFPHQLAHVPLAVFYSAINRVSRSLIRTDADELTYNLHVLIRFELECELLEGRLAVADLPEKWRASYRNDLGTASEGDSDGVLQDMHWYSGLVGGAFQGYTIGNILGAQFYQAALEAQPGISDEISVGKFRSLHSWLAENVWRHGRKYSPDDLLHKAVGSEMSIEPYIAYLQGKYRSLSTVPL